MLVGLANKVLMPSKHQLLTSCRVSLMRRTLGYSPMTAFRYSVKPKSMFGPSQLFMFSSAPPPAKPISDADQDNEKSQESSTKTYGDYSFTEDEIKGTTRGQDGLLLMAYTCGKCEQKQARTFSRHSYEQGVVLIRCESCDSLHLIADNLGWFEDDKVNIQQIMDRKGENVTTNITQDGIEITRPRITDHEAADLSDEPINTNDAKP